MTSFVGRQRELKRLRLLLEKESASFVVIRGRRRIGKSRLIEEFGRNRHCHVLTGIPPRKGMTRQSQLDEFCFQMCAAFGLPQIRVQRWAEAFQYLARLASSGQLVLALDEISWMGSKDPDFLGQLKTAWDHGFSKNPQLILIVCGSVSSWIERNILSSTGFVGRISLDLQLRELPVGDAALFWGDRIKRTSPYEILSSLAITGGVPRYLEELVTHRTPEENIRALCFESDGLLFREFDQIFSDLFSSRGPAYAAILQLLSTGPRGFQDICTHLGNRRRATVSSQLQHLSQAGFVLGDATWNLASGKTSTLKRFRLSDNYIRFYLRYIEPKKEQIQQGLYKQGPLSGLPGWEAMMGLQFENLVINNAFAIFDLLGIDTGDIERFGPFFQRQTARRMGCQVDLLIQLRQPVVFVCEVKFSMGVIGMAVAHQMERVCERIALPRGCSTRRVLIHVNGVTSDVAQSKTFDHILNFGQFL